ncbi:MAG: NCS2 family permease [Clostridiales bacterium]|jgi:AGZA family xanthine/uracil permease-like MFS transporter|nr:NCS2 family permease [Clostridiales bacterium]
MASTKAPSNAIHPKGDFFNFKGTGSNPRTEIVAGLTTFFTMAYIIFVNPPMLKDAGMDQNAVLIATCLAAALGTVLMGLLSNYPFALASGMGLNAFFAYTICGQMGYSWQAGLAAVFLSGVIFIIITVTGLRTAIVNAIPLFLKKAIGGGIGLFIAFIGLKNAGIIAASESTFVSLDKFNNPHIILAVIGLILTIALVVWKVKGGLLISILGTSAIGAVMQYAMGFDIGMPTDVAFNFNLDLGPTFGQCFTGFGELFSTGKGVGVLIFSIISVLLSLTMVDMFDTIGTLVGAASKGGFLDKEGNLPNANRALLADAIATTTGAVLGTSTVTTYVESSSGISEGGRTGLTSLTTAACFVLAIFAMPLLGFVPSAATAPILIVVGVMMASSIKEIEWQDIEIAIPAFFTLLMMPLAYSIADGIAFGCISYTVIKLVKGQPKKVHPVMYVITLLFLARYVIQVFQ